MLAGLVGAAAAIYVIALVFLYTQQSRMIHQTGPGNHELIATPSAIGFDWEDVRLTTSDGIRLHGWYLPAKQSDVITLLFFHGNAGNISHRLDSLDLFRQLGVAVLIIDYRGYGQSKGDPSEEGLYRDAEAAWRYLADERDVPPQRIVASGRSLGAAVAARVAAEHPVGGLIVESGFTSVPALGAERYPVFPVRLLTRFEYPTREFIRQASAPVLVVHSPDDEAIPYHHGRSLFEAANEPKTFLEIQGGHNTGYLDSREDYTQGLRDFLRAVRDSGTASARDGND